MCMLAESDCPQNIQKDWCLYISTNSDDEPLHLLAESDYPRNMNGLVFVAY